MAIGTHAWFICNAVAGAVFAPFVLRSLGAPPLALGLALSAAGIGGLAGSLSATQLGERFGAGRVVIGCRVLTAVGFGLVCDRRCQMAGPQICRAGGPVRHRPLDGRRERQ